MTATPIPSSILRIFAEQRSFASAIDVGRFQRPAHAPMPKLGRIFAERQSFGSAIGADRLQRPAYAQSLQASMPKLGRVLAEHQSFASKIGADRLQRRPAYAQSLQAAPPPSLKRLFENMLASPIDRSLASKIGADRLQRPTYAQSLQATMPKMARIFAERQSFVSVGMSPIFGQSLMNTIASLSAVPAEPEYVLASEPEAAEQLHALQRLWATLVNLAERGRGLPFERQMALYMALVATYSAIIGTLALLVALRAAK